MKPIYLVIAVVGVAVWAIVAFSSITIGESSEWWIMDDQQVWVEYGYSQGGDRLRFAIIRTWPKDATPEQKILDGRVGRDFLGRLLVRDPDGRMSPVGLDGDVYFFEGDKLKRMRVRMSESDDTIGLGNSKTLDEMWAHFKRFEVETGD